MHRRRRKVLPDAARILVACSSPSPFLARSFCRAPPTQGSLPISSPRTFKPSSTMRPHNLEALKTAAASDLAHPDFRNIRWAGIFGSFSRGTATESSDVDVVVIEAPYDWSVTKQLLEDVLPVAWSRSVDVIHISEGQTDFRGYIQLESLLASRTIFLRDHAARDEVSRLRTLAKQTVDKGQALYSGVASRIDAVRRLVDQVSLQDFVGWPKEQHVDILSQVSLILGDLDIQPKHHAMREAF
ncbi:hypothetical protein B0I35DRAFT_515719 [Stachybotrys elegans]|uniref:Polymerase beta nucleotidyltransferase domain-containing protein n=1 Tax=Stachybotrys elegans TaxID=80388 RepID=A0A8K0SD28_9HYPO|nr:hypothetical protein B0I35DRAFT_515719 [Stachybotrys elegans]